MRMRNLRAGEPEGGQVAIVVAASLIILLGMAAFAVDLGLTYSDTRQLQTASDAAATAAAGYMADKPGASGMSCGTTSTTHGAAAEAHGEAVMQDNDVDAVKRDVDIDCTTLPGPTGPLPFAGVGVEWTSESTTETFFGPLLGSDGTDTDEITTNRYAKAALTVANTAYSGVRPYAVCSRDLPDPGTPLPTTVRKVQYVTTDAGNPLAPCPSANNPGNFWSLRCPEVASSSNAELEEKTRNGCESPIREVPSQPAATPATGSPALRDHLVNVGCADNPPRADSDCLRADPGNISGAGIWSAWQSLLGKKILLPAFCGESAPTTAPNCAPAAVYDAGGSNAHYPVHRLVGVTICGFDWGNAPAAERQISTGVCANNPSGHVVGPGDNYILVAYDIVPTVGGTGPTTCRMGDPTCDRGARRVILVE